MVTFTSAVKPWISFFLLVVKRLFIGRNSSALVWLFWWFLWNRKAVSGECVWPHARRVYKWVITNFSPVTMVLLLVRIYTGNNQLISTVLCCSNTGLNNKDLSAGQNGPVFQSFTDPETKMTHFVIFSKMFLRFTFRCNNNYIIIISEAIIKIVLI